MLGPPQRHAEALRSPLLAVALDHLEDLTAGPTDCLPGRAPGLLGNEGAAGEGAAVEVLEGDATRTDTRGGKILKRCYFGDCRFSEDRDFTLTEEVPFEAIRAELDGICDDARRRSGVAFRYARDDRRPHEDSHTFYLGYEGPLPATSGGREVKVDITKRERLVFPLAERAVLRGYAEYDDLPEGATVRAYSLAEVAAEKLAAVTDRARNEPRDLYDLWYLAEGDHIDLAALRPALADKLAFRGRTSDRLGAELAAKEVRLKKLWATRLAAQMATLPEFDATFRAVRRRMRAAGMDERSP